MKKTIFLLAVLLMIISGKSFSKNQDEPINAQVKPTLLIIDIQNTYLKMVPEKEKAVAMYYINSLIELFRSNGYPIVRIYHLDKESGLKPGDEQFEYPLSVLVKEDDARVIKTYGDGFNKTDLDKIIKENGSNTLFLCGFSAVGCVLSTWIGAQNHDYNAFLIKSAIMSSNSEKTSQIENIFDAISYNAVKLIIESSAKAN